MRVLNHVSSGWQFYLINTQTHAQYKVYKNDRECSAAAATCANLVCRARSPSPAHSSLQSSQVLRKNGDLSVPKISKKRVLRQRQLSATIGDGRQREQSWLVGRQIRDCWAESQNCERKASADIGSHREPSGDSESHREKRERARATKVSALLLKIPRSTHSGQRVDLFNHI